MILCNKCSKKLSDFEGKLDYLCDCGETNYYSDREAARINGHHPLITNAVEIKRPESAVTKEEKEYFVPAEIKPKIKIERFIHLFEKSEHCNIMRFDDSYFHLMYESDGDEIMLGVRKRKIPNVSISVYISTFILDYLLPVIRNEKEFRHYFCLWMIDNNRHIFIEPILKDAKDKCFIKFDMDLKYNTNGMVAEQYDEDGEFKSSFAAGPIPARLLLADEMQFCREVLNAKY